MPTRRPNTWCAEMWHLGYGKMAVIPSVNLENSKEAANKIKAANSYVRRSEAFSLQERVIREMLFLMEDDK